MRRIDSEQARQIVEAGQVMPRDELERIAAARHPARKDVLGFEYGEDETAPGRYRFAVEVEDAAGGVWWIELDAHTGEILEEDNSASR
ncbi:PepSY domain-containing protein [Streptomyces sp. NPDC059349]|uniref:PepSY domain-containing protein n=1 Tax=Streptomyces sp. NPDC059349 TaxID=3346808 RepID=UPI00368D0C4E